jgi:hypothetical protein
MEEVNAMAKKDKYDAHADPSFNRAHGRRDGAPPKQNEPQREKNVGHGSAEEHSKTAKGNSDQRAKAAVTKAKNR